MTAFHVYVEGPVERTPDGIQRLAVAISKKYGLPVPDLVKRMTAGRFRVKANIDAATADAYARALEEVGARVKVEEAHPTMPVPITPEPAPPSKSGPIPAAARTAPPADEQPRKKAPTLPGEKPSRSGYYSVSPPPSSKRTAVPTTPPRSKTPSDGPPREAHEKSSLMPPGREPPPRPMTEPIELPPPRPVGDSIPPPIPARPASSSLPPPTTARPASSSLPPATGAPRPASSSLPPATGAPRTAASSLPPATGTPRTAPSSLPPANERSGSSSLPPANASRASNPAFQSGLSAAYSQEIPLSADLGAIGNDSYSLSSLDGNDAPASEDQFAPSPGMPASIGPKPEAAPAKPAPRASTPAPLDMFAPPDAEEAEQVVNLAVDTSPPKRTERPTTPALGAATTSAMRKAPPSQGAVMGGTAAREMPRSRIVAGIFLAILLGFIPAHLIASSREASSFKKIDAQIVATQAAADTPEMYATLDPFREAQLARKESERRSIAMQSMLLWAVVAAGLGYVWFRRIPWDRMPRA